MNKIDKLFEKNSFFNDILRLILLHQSLPCLEKFKTDLHIPKETIPNYFDHRLMKLMKVLMQYDSESYLINFRRDYLILHRIEFNEVFKIYDQIIEGSI